MHGKFLTAGVAACALLAAAGARAAEVNYAAGITGNAVQVFEELVAPWEEATGHDARLVPMPASTTDQFGQYRLWLAAQNKDIDLYQTDVIWAPQLAEHFVDLKEAAGDLVEKHFCSLVVGDKGIFIRPGVYRVTTCVHCV